MKLSEEATATFERCTASSEEGLEKIRAAATEMFGGDDRFVIGVNGSYARREVTAGSDVDIFILTLDDDPTKLKAGQVRFREYLRDQLGLKLPADDGVFENPLAINAVSNRIGGREDTNDNITRRMLLLLEGEWIFNERLFIETRRKLLSRYLHDNLVEEKICMFLLNDIIRYWRTICVDYEYKVEWDNKPKAIRLIKLRFSRMMLYVAGIFAVGETFGKSAGKKLEVLTKYFAIPPLQRFNLIVGEEGAPALELYASFLSALDDNAIRATLEGNDDEALSSPEFINLSKNARAFKKHLRALMIGHFEEDNPTIPAILI